MKLKRSIPGMVVVSLLVGVIAALLIGLVPARRQFADQSYRTFPIILKASQADIQSELARGWDIALSISRSPFLIDWMEGAETDQGLGEGIEAMLLEVMNRPGVMSGFTATASTGNFRVGDRVLNVLDPNRSDDSWFFDSLRETREVMLNLDFNPELGETLLWFNAAVIRGGDRIGIAGIGLSIDEAVESFQNAVPSPGSVLSLVDTTGRILVSSDTTALDSSISEYLPSESQVVPGHPGIHRYHSAASGTMIMAESALEDTGYRMVLLAPEEEFVPSFLDFAGLSLLFMILFVVVASWLTYLLIVARLRGLETLRGMLQDIARGEGDLTKRLAANRTDEIGELAEGFNQTLDTFSHLVGIIKVQAHKLSSLGGDLASNMTQTAAAITEVIATIQSVKNQVLRQAASVEQTSQTTGAITSSIEDLNTRIEQQSSNVTQSSAAIEEMLSSIQSVTGTLVKNSAAIQNLTSLSEQGREALEAMASDIKIVALDSDSLLEISQVIHDIASQTNLLSMNAAIEAAHAGESGKGFAVVAEEIRKLAETSGEESKKIAAVLAKIKTSVDGITAATGEVQTQFEHIYSEVKTVSHQESMIKNAMEEQNAGSQEVYTAISELTDITESVKDRSRDMLQGSTEVTRESKNLRTITEEITHSMNEMSQGVQEITQAVSFVDEMTRENQGSIDALLAEIGRFKIEE